MWLASHQRLDGRWGPGGACACFDRPVPAVVKRADVGRRVATLVAMLGVDDLEERTLAAAEIERIGWAALPFLEEAGPVEARLRIREVVARIKGADPDGEDLAATACAALVFLNVVCMPLGREILEGVPTDVLQDALAWLMRQQRADGSIGAAPERGVRAGQALAAYVLCRAFRVTGVQPFGDAGKRAVDWIVARQHANGAWGPGLDDAECTFWSVLALKNAGVRDDASQRALEWRRAWLKFGGELDAAHFVALARTLDRAADVSAHVERVARWDLKGADAFGAYVAGLAVVRGDGSLSGWRHASERWMRWRESKCENFEGRQAPMATLLLTLGGWDAE